MTRYRVASDGTLTPVAQVTAEIIETPQGLAARLTYEGHDPEVIPMNRLVLLTREETQAGRRV